MVQQEDMRQVCRRFMDSVSREIGGGPATEEEVFGKCRTLAERSSRSRGKR